MPESGPLTGGGWCIHGVPYGPNWSCDQCVGAATDGYSATGGNLTPGRPDLWEAENIAWQRAEAVAAERERIVREVEGLRREKPWPLFVTAADMAETARTANNNVVDDVLAIVREDTDAR